MNPLAVEILGHESIAILELIRRFINCASGAIHNHNIESLHVFLKSLFGWALVGVVEFNVKLIRVRPRTRNLLRVWDKLFAISRREDVLESISG